jgi:hypothetical protein
VPYFPIKTGFSSLTKEVFMFWNPFFTLIGELAYPQLKQENEFLKAENAILRNHNLKIRMILTDAEKNTLIRLGAPLGR